MARIPKVEVERLKREWSFAAYGFALGDIAEAAENGEDAYNVRAVVRPTRQLWILDRRYHQLVRISVRRYGAFVNRCGISFRTFDIFKRSSPPLLRRIPAALHL